MVNFEPPLTRYHDRWQERAKLQSDIPELRKQLLALGGDEVVPSHEPDLSKLLSRGQRIEPTGVVKVQMRASQCHENAAILYREEESITEIGAGWALSDDGLWRQHSWAHRGDELVETTESRVQYFGLYLSEEEAEEFVKKNTFLG